MKNNTFKAKGFLVWGVCALFFLYEFFLRTVVGTFQSSITYDLGLTSFQFSLLSTTFFLLVYGFMQIPAGIILENIGLKRALLLAVSACTISTFGFAYASGYALAIFFRLLMGFGASFGFLCLLISVRDWMPHKYSGLFIGLSQFIGTLGPMVAAGPLDTLLHTTGVSWRLVFFYLAIIGCILTVLIFFYVENNKDTAGKFVVLHKPEKVSTLLKKLLSKWQPWYIGLLSAGLFFSIEYLSENEGRAFLLAKGISLTTAAYMLTLAWFGYAVGSPLLGALSDVLKRRKSVVVASALLSCISIAGIVYGTQQNILLASFFALGFSASGQGVCFAITAEYFKKQFTAVGFGLNNAILNTISAINAPLIGLLLDYTKKSEHNSLTEYVSVFSILVAISVVALFVAFFLIQETYCKSKVDFTYLNTQK